MQILWWLVPSAVVTGLAMLVAGWVGRVRPERERSEADQERFAQALMRPLPGAQGDGRSRSRSRERSTGVAVRRTPPDPDPNTRRSA